MTEAEMTLGETLALYRDRRGMTQVEVAAAAGINVNTYGHIERDEGNPTLSTLRRVATALGCRLEIAVLPVLEVLQEKGV